MSLYDEYVIDCIRNNKPVNGRKLHSLRESMNGEPTPLKQLYVEAKGCDIPLCEVCKSKEVEFVSIAKGFRKYCSVECYGVAQSRRNTRKNAMHNAIIKQTHIEKYAPVVKKAAQDYLEGTSSIAQLEQQYQLPQGRLRLYLHENDLTDRSRQKASRQVSLDNKLGRAYAALDDINWVSQQIQTGWTSRLFANHLGCSPNFVCERLRRNGIFLSDYNSGSSFELQLTMLLDQWDIPYIRNDRTVLNGKEIDILLPSLSLGIEVNGLYWHQHYPGKSDIKRHLNKTEACERLGIRLLHFTDKEISESFDKVKSILSSAVKQSKTIYARKCEVRQISSKQWAEFINRNHLQGSINSSVKLGLFYDGEMVSAMGFAKPRFNKQFEYELTRFCNMLNVNVVGAASKLYSHFIRMYAPQSIISYCDRRLFTGAVYHKLGMMHTHNTPPNYLWVHSQRTGDIKTRYQTQRHMLINCPSEWTESEYMSDKGYYKIYDCGQSVFSYTRGN